jgi:hypothetical protein
MRQKIVAAKYGIPGPVLSRTLNGRIKVANMTVTRALTLAKIFDLDIEALVAASPAELKMKFTARHETGDTHGKN